MTSLNKSQHSFPSSSSTIDRVRTGGMSTHSTDATMGLIGDVVTSIERMRTAYRSNRNIAAGVREKRQKLSTPTRRLRAFVIDFEGREARVAFIDSQNKMLEYILPAKCLREAGITQQNQPFQVDEIENYSKGEYTITYKFEPMAPANAGFSEYIALDPDLDELRNEALKYFGTTAEHPLP